MEVFMGKVVAGMAMSLDGFINDRNGSVGRLYPDLDALRKTDILQEAIRTTGAVVIGRRAYDMADGDFTGYEFQVPIFVLTHAAPQKVAKGENGKLKFTFVTDGIESAIRQAKAAAGNKNVTVIGGASTVQQLLRAGLVDEIQIGLMSVLLGGGTRLFENTGSEPIELESAGVIESLGVSYLRFRPIKRIKMK
jgi:dihydrofolate reductase